MLASLVALGLLAQEPAPQPEPAPEVAQPAQTAEEAVAPTPVSEEALEMLSRLPASLEGWGPDEPMFGLAQQVFAMVGREDLIERFQPGAFAPSPCPVLSPEGLDPMYAAMADAQIVIVNEAHNQPLHRHFIQGLAQRLGGEFDVFAAETFNYLRIMEPRQPGALGFYDREPIFHRQIDAVEASGYRLVAYEIRAAQRDPSAQTRAERIAVREEAQADNLIAEVLADAPEARILVHVGYSHVLEAPMFSGEDQPPLEWFAYRLKQKTGIDPVTISQTHCAPPAPSVDGPDEVSASLPLGAVALGDPEGMVPDAAIDFAIVHPPMTFDQGRPAWRRAIGDVDLAAPEALLPVDAPVVLEARAPNEPLAALPIERLMLYPGDAHPLLLPPGDWVISAWSSEGAFGEPVTVAVP
jgi:hypothetical protein